MEPDVGQHPFNSTSAPALVNTSCTCVQARDPNTFGAWAMSQRPINSLARRLAFAVVEWLASDGADDLYENVVDLAQQWKVEVIDGAA